jgi:hypothetical protein
LVWDWTFFLFPCPFPFPCSRFSLLTFMDKSISWICWLPGKFYSECIFIMGNHMYSVSDYLFVYVIRQGLDIFQNLDLWPISKFGPISKFDKTGVGCISLYAISQSIIHKRRPTLPRRYFLCHKGRPTLLGSYFLCDHNLHCAPSYIKVIFCAAATCTVLTYRAR